MMKPKRLIEIYKTPRINGLFYGMSQISDFATLFSRLDINDEDDYHALDMDYILNHSGLKTISMLLQYMFTGYIINDDEEYCYDLKGNKVSWDYVLQEIDQDLINTIISKRFYEKWYKLIDTLLLDYEVLSPYNMTIKENTGEGLESEGTNTGEASETLQNTSSRQDATDRNIYAFNSSSEVNESGDDTTSESTSTDTNSSNRTTSDTYKRQTNTNRDVTRTGNIGNHTNQELIEEQRRLLKYQILDEIYNDLDSVLTRSKYI